MLMAEALTMQWDQEWDVSSVQEPGQDRIMVFYSSLNFSNHSGTQ